nr:hypothetical protein L203_00223 [Cryptococcus depauperatus CBS 7841]
MALTPPTTMKATSRRSWFSFGRSKAQSIAAEEASLQAPNDRAEIASNVLSAYDADPSERLRPIQFSPNRIATLYVTPSERDLYLSAMEELDKSPPPLPLWTDPAPALPQVKVPATPLDPPKMPSVYEPRTNAWTNRPYSPKLFPGGDVPTGLLVRDEFSKYTAPKAANHALLALSPPSEMRFTGFPPNLLVAVDAVIREEWPLGVMKRTEEVDELKSRGEKDILVWNVQLQGKAWKKKGNEELDTIRLLLGLFKVLGKYGWTLLESIYAGGGKNDTHNLLFSYTPETVLVPPVFFALSIPLPDRLSLINPPLKSTPTLISALRTAILDTSPLKMSQHSNGTITWDTTDADLVEKARGREKDWQGYDPRGIKLEGWVHEGVYRFWVDGMRRWGGSVFKKKIIDNIHPMLVIRIVNHFTSHHFQLAGSVPLLPFTRGRDVLIFQSLPTSGLTIRDSFVPRSVSEYAEVAPNVEAKSTHAAEQDTSNLNGEPQWTGWIAAEKQANPKSPSPTRNRGPAASSARSRLSSLTNALRRSSSRGSRASNSNSGTDTPKQKGNVLKKNSVRRKSVPVLPSSYKPHGQKQTEKQLKRSSEGSMSLSGGNVVHRSGSDGTVHPARDEHHFVVTNATSQDREDWSLVNPSASVEDIGRVPPVELRPSEERTLWSRPSGPAFIPPRSPNRSPIHGPAKLHKVAGGRGRGVYEHANKTSHDNASGESIYHDAPPAETTMTAIATDSQNRVSPRASLDNIHIPSATLYSPGKDDSGSSIVAQPLKLGHPLPTPPDEQNGTTLPSYSVPLPQINTLGPSINGSPKRRVGVMEPTSHVGRIESMHGSVGFSGSVISHDSRPPSLPPKPTEMSSNLHNVTNLATSQGYGGTFQFPTPNVTSRGVNEQNRGGNGDNRERKSKVWDEDRGMWVDLPGIRDGPGSARTKINIGR